MTTSRLDTLRKFLEAEPNDSFTRYAIALEYASQHKLPEAIAELEGVLAMDPNYIPAYQQLGNVLRQSGNIAEAVQILENGIRAAGASGDQHARHEMQEVLDELENA